MDEPQRRPQPAVPDDFRAFCLNCFYDLRGLPTGRCPECGRAFDPDDPRTYSLTPSPERLHKLLNRTATALLDGLQLLNPADPETARRLALDRRLGNLQRENADLRVLVELLIELLEHKGVVRPEEIEDLRLRVQEAVGTGPITVVDDTADGEESDADPDPDLLDLGRAAGDQRNPE